MPIGGFSLMIGLYTVMTVLMRQKYDSAFEPWLLLAGVLAGVATDAVYAKLRPSLARSFALRTFAALVPALSTTDTSTPPLRRPRLTGSAPIGDRLRPYR